MKDARIRLPVVCPICGVDSLANLCLTDIVRGLCCGQNIALASQCHGARWDANEIEIEQIKDYFMATIFYAQETSAAGDAIHPAVDTDSSIEAATRLIPSELA